MLSKLIQRLLLSVLLLSALALQAKAALTADDLFNPDVLQEIRLQVNTSDWQRLKDYFRENTYYPAILEWRGIVVEDIGIRSRGRSSRSPIKPNLRIDINRYEDDKTFLGLRAFHLKSNNTDASFLKERLSMLMFQRMGLPASRETHARVYVNGDYVGLYLLVEEINKEYLTRNLGENEGYLYEWTAPEERYQFEYLGPDPNNYSPVPFEPKTRETNPNPKPLEAMIRTINQASGSDFPSAIAKYLDLKMFVTHVAIETFLADLDCILGDRVGMNNFYFYRFKGNDFSQFLVWDKDLTFSAADRDIWRNANGNVLMRRALAIPEIRNAYMEALVKAAVLAGGPAGWLQQEIARELNQIRTAAFEDPFKQYEGQHNSTNDIFLNEVARVSAFAGERSDAIFAQVKTGGFRLSPDSPGLTDVGVVNRSTGMAGSLTPGAAAAIHGDSLSANTAAADPSNLPLTLGGVMVFINGFPAQLQSVSPTQINLVVPREIQPDTAPVTVFASGVLGNTVTVNVDR